MLKKIEVMMFLLEVVIGKREEVDFHANQKGGERGRSD